MEFSGCRWNTSEACNSRCFVWRWSRHWFDLTWNKFRWPWKAWRCYTHSTGETSRNQDWMYTIHPRFYGERKKRRKVNKVHPWNLDNDWFKPKGEHIQNPKDACVHSWVDACSVCHQVPWIWAPEHRETQGKDLKGCNLCFVNPTCWRLCALCFWVWYGSMTCFDFLKCWFLVCWSMRPVYCIEKG